ncbi:helix-turn-helix domain-containing protein [Gulosibacter molinativorax]|uniref:DNA-binding protein n=1 Tax=Gulosibacter molinativorax TaxID=256821 RepID=A0ABT7CBY7_9MICO|nr:helix-turn-helix domain-containing protein [Gulosibacter molinativorax]MDJ1372664.1 DNA-binding protein [Gulosibacter molinativorax]QUY62400.1 Hypotetical protein [Gulosibacter molinativorax]
MNSEHLHTNRRPVDTKPSASDALLTLQEVAERLRSSRSTVYEYINAGELPTIVLGNRRRVRPSDLESFIYAHRDGGPRHE